MTDPTYKVYGFIFAGTREQSAMLTAHIQVPMRTISVFLLVEFL